MRLLNIKVFVFNGLAICILPFNAVLRSLTGLAYSEIFNQSLKVMLIVIIDFKMLFFIRFRICDVYVNKNVCFRKSAVSFRG